MPVAVSISTNRHMHDSTFPVVKSKCEDTRLVSLGVCIL